MKHPAVKIPFGPFMLAQNEEMQHSFASACRFGKLPPQEEMEHINSTSGWELFSSKLDLSRTQRFSYDADVREKMWWVMAIQK